MLNKTLKVVNTLHTHNYNSITLNKRVTKESQNKKKGISLIVLVITIIVIIILAAAVILTLTNNNPINNAKQAAFVNDLDSFKSELDMYKASEYAKRIGDFEQNSLEGDEISLTFDGQTPEEAGNQTMYTAIPSLKGITKYAGQFAIEEGKLVYRGKDLVKKDWAASVGVAHSVAGEPKVVASVTGDDVIEPGTDIVYTVQVQSTDTITLLDTASIKSKIKLLTKAGVEVATQPNMIVSEPTGTPTAKQFTVTVPTNTLPYGEYKLQILEGIATNTENVVNQPYTTVHVFEITDNTPPDAPEISAVPPTAYTSGNVVVTIDYKDADVKLYSFTGNLGDWQTYTSALTITTNNTTVYAMGKDNAENETGIVTKTIANIDKVAPQNAAFNLTVTDDTISGTITLADNESGISLANSKYLVTNSSTALVTNATEWNTATVLTTNPQSISVTKDNGDYYVQTLSTDAVGNKRVNVSGVITVAHTGITDPGYVVSKGVNGPVLKTGMIPVKWSSNGNTVIQTTYDDTEWYDYSAKKWANAITKDTNGNVTAYWVWIPRYEYKIPTPHTSTAQTISVNFINGTGTTATSGYTMHPGFTFGSDELKGIWVAKFEASISGGVVVLPSVAAAGSGNMNLSFTRCRTMETTYGAKYGWGTSGVGIDTHLMKNVEWGAVAYLSSSIYGKTGQVNMSTHTNTGGGSYISNISQSTTENVYGVYDMNGGLEELVAAYVNNGSNELNNATTLIAAEEKYRDVYEVGSTDSQTNNYIANSLRIGDAMYETSTAGYGTTSWYGDKSFMPALGMPFVIRGGYYGDTGGTGNSAGVFAYMSNAGYGHTTVGFRPVLAVGAGL